MQSTKTVYQTDSNGFYVGETVAHLCQITRADWHIPAGAVEEPPPITLPGQAARLIQGQWVVVDLPLSGEGE